MQFYFACGVEYKENFYLAAQECNALFFYNPKTKQLKYLTAFEKEKGIYALYRTTLLRGNEAWFIPERGEYIVCVNLDTMEKTWFPLEGTITWNDIKIISAKMFSDRYLYTVPYSMDTAMIIDIEDKKIEKVKKVSNENHSFIDAYFYEDNICFVPREGKTYIQWNVQTDEVKEKNWSYSELMVVNALVDSECDTVWYTPGESQKIVVENIKTEEKEYIPYNNSLKKVNQNIWKLHSYYGKQLGNKIFMLPFLGKNILAIDRKTKDLTYYPVPEDKTILPFLRMVDSEQLCAVVEQYLVIYDEKQDEFVYNLLEIAPHDLYMQVKESGGDWNLIQSNRQFYETNMLLEDFIDLVMEDT